MISVHRAALSVSKKHHLGILLVVLAQFVMMPSVLHGHEKKKIVVHRGSTPAGDIIRARADAALLLRQAELVGEKAYSKRLDNMIKECDVLYKRFATRKKIRKEAVKDKRQRVFDAIQFNQQLAKIRAELEQKAVMKRTRVGDPTDDMNFLLEKFARQSIDVSRIKAMDTELTPEQLDAIFLTDGSNTFSGKTGKTRLEAFNWPFFIQRREFQGERKDFEVLYEKAVNEIGSKGSLSPETAMGLLAKVDAIDKRLDSLPLSDNPSVLFAESKWHKEAKSFLRELVQSIGDCSKLDSERLSKYMFQGKNLGELIGHLNSKGLRFARPRNNDSNLYASIFFIMRYAYQEYQKPLNHSTQKASPQSKQVVSSVQLVISVQEPWPVSIEVKKGQELQITARGSFRRKPGAKKRGVGDRKYYFQGWFGKGKPFKIGASRSLTIKEDGLLYLGVRDPDILLFKHHVGKVNVTIKVVKDAKRLEEIGAAADEAGPPPDIAPFDAKEAKDRQLRWARHLNVPVEWENSIGMKFVLIPPGEYLMGSTNEKVTQLIEEAKQKHGYVRRLPNEAPQHKVRITQPFWLGVTEVTQTQYQRIMGSNPSKFQGEGQRPVEQVSWNDCVDFCRRLSELPEEKAAKRHYGLPTEAQWEYACRAGNPRRRWFSTQPNPLPKADEEKLLGQCAWFRANAGSKTHPVGQLRPNPWGLHGMYGNVLEWCQDWYDGGYYVKSRTDNPLGPETGSDRVARGGSWNNHPWYCRSAYRLWYTPDRRVSGLGFRVAASVDAPGK